MGRNNKDDKHGALLAGSSQTCTDEDFSTCSEGDVIDKLTIASVFFKSNSCIVFVDRDQNLSWRTNDDYGDYPEDFGSVMGRIDFLHSTPDDLLTTNQREGFQRLLGGAIARLLDDKNGLNAHPILDKAEAFLKIRTTERARIWFLSSSFVVTVIALAAAGLLLLFRNTLQQRLGATAFDVSLAVPMGALGALLSMALRLTKLDIDAMAGAKVHYFEGAVRTIAGMGGALLIALCVKANVLLGLINASANSLAFLLAVATVAGASERLVPNLIKKVEGTLIVDGSKSAGPHGPGEPP